MACPTVARAAAPEVASTASEATPAKGRAGSSGIGSGIKLENVSTTCAVAAQPALRARVFFEQPRVGVLGSAAFTGLQSLLLQVSITFKNQQVLRDITWEVSGGGNLPRRWALSACYPCSSQIHLALESAVTSAKQVKKGERVGLVGVNGAGKTTQLQASGGCLQGLRLPRTLPGPVHGVLPFAACCWGHLLVPPVSKDFIRIICYSHPFLLQIIIGALTPDGGEIIKAKENMKIAYLTQVSKMGCRHCVWFVRVCASEAEGGQLRAAAM